jgi:hypothetical protein
MGGLWHWFTHIGMKISEEWSNENPYGEIGQQTMGMSND